MKGLREDLKKYRAEEKELSARLDTVRDVIDNMEHTLALEEPKKPRGSKGRKQDVLDEAPKEQEDYALDQN